MTDSVKSAARGGYTSHGHQIPGAAIYPPDRPRVVRCGGVGICDTCSQQSARWHSEQNHLDESDVAKVAAQRAVRIRELDAEVKRLRAQVTSFGRVNPGTYATKEQRPDDTEVDEDIAQAESFADAVWTISEKYGADVTGNMERWQDGKFLREVGDFIGDVKKVAEKFLVKPAEVERDELKAKLAKVRKCVEAEKHYNEDCGWDVPAIRILAILDGEVE